MMIGVTKKMIVITIKMRRTTSPSISVFPSEECDTMKILKSIFAT